MVLYVSHDDLTIATVSSTELIHVYVMVKRTVVWRTITLAFIAFPSVKAWGVEIPTSLLINNGTAKYVRTRRSFTFTSPVDLILTSS